MTKDEVLAYIPAQRRAAAEAFLTRHAGLHLPFFVRALVFAGALLSAVFLAWVADDLLRGIVPTLLRGVLFMTLGVWLVHTAQKHTALQAAWRNQLGQLVGLAGQLLLFAGITKIPGVQIWMSAVVVAAVSYPVFKTPFNRFIWCAWSASCLFPEVNNAWNHLGIALSALGAAGAALWVFSKCKFRLYPLAYALIWWSVICAEETTGLKMCWYGLNPINAGLAGIVAVYAVLSHRGNWTRRQIVFSAGAVILAALLNWPTSLALILMYAGFTLRDRMLEGLGTAGVAGGLFLFYFTLNTSLSAKAALLMVSGLVLLGLRRVYAK